MIQNNTIQNRTPYTNKVSTGCMGVSMKGVYSNSRGRKNPMVASRQITKRYLSGGAIRTRRPTHYTYLTREKKDTVSSAIRHAAISSADRHSDVHGCALVPCRTARATTSVGVGARASELIK